ncbi:hypothetical protein V495_05428 [Pseudogymnoascus sp. VKM F-4514 (FW-929)]|nr:hypothetical protein V495_05428 [Pseudogymnoascus sp. VKM F-4514 (FW-929)]KFY58717.1 hypothetical protein V497_04693 [Pseudogymnoascus sp. VKM F-4516 (FW-969)]
MSGTSLPFVSAGCCVLRRFPPEIMDLILKFATLGEPPMPAIIKALRGSKASHDIYKSALYHYYSLNPMIITTKKVGGLIHMTHDAAESTRELHIIFWASVTPGRVSRIMMFPPDRPPMTVDRQEPDGISIVPFLRWDTMMKFAGLRQFHMDMYGYPEEKFHMVQNLVKNMRGWMPRLKRLSLNIKLPRQLPLLFLEENTADEAISEENRVQTMLWEIHDTFFDNLPHCKCESFFKNKANFNSMQDLIDFYMHLDIAGVVLGIHDIMDVALDAEKIFEKSASNMAEFLDSINSHVGSSGKMQRVRTGPYQKFSWDISPIRKPVPGVGISHTYNMP